MNNMNSNPLVFIINHLFSWWLTYINIIMDDSDSTKCSLNDYEQFICIMDSTNQHRTFTQISIGISSLRSIWRSSSLRKVSPKIWRNCSTLLDSSKPLMSVNRRTILMRRSSHTSRCQRQQRKLLKCHGTATVWQVGDVIRSPCGSSLGVSMSRPESNAATHRLAECWPTASIDVLFPLVGWLIEGFEQPPLTTGKWW